MLDNEVVKCVADYSGTTQQGKAITLQQGKQYFVTKGPEYIYINDYDDPATQLPWLTKEEYSALEGAHLQKIS